MIMGPIMAIAASFLPSKSGSIFGKSITRVQGKNDEKG